MKSIKIFAVALVAFVLFSIESGAQPKEQNNWQEKMMSEKIAFITTELNLSPEEAQVFWPVYNQIAKEQEEKQLAVKAAMAALNKALAEGAEDKEIDRLLDEYLAAKLANNTKNKAQADRFRKVLSSEKVAKLYIAEEKFRRMHIRNLGGNKGHNAHGKPQGGKPHPRQ